MLQRLVFSTLLLLKYIKTHCAYYYCILVSLGDERIVLVVGLWCGLNIQSISETQVTSLGRTLPSR